MILHIAYDEKVINRCIENFEEVFPHNNKFLIICKNDNPQHVIHPLATHTKYNKPDFWAEVGDINQYSAVVIHYLGLESADFVNKINHRNIYWIEWGGDLYNHLLYARGFELYSDNKIKWRYNNKILHYIFPFRIYNLLSKRNNRRICRNVISAIYKMKYFVPDSMYDEYELILKYYPEFCHLEYKDFFYYPIDEVISKDIINSRCHGNNIIIGNSASLSANHLAVFESLSKTEIGEKKIIVPLSYGNMEYANSVDNIGRIIFGGNFCAIRHFMSLSDYNKLLLSAEIFIYGNWRQEAVGNILTALYLGGKVVLFEKNPLFKFYKRMGIKIYGMSQLTTKFLDERIDKRDVENNRTILQRMYSKERLHELIRTGFKNEF